MLHESSQCQCQVPGARSQSPASSELDEEMGPRPWAAVPPARQHNVFRRNVQALCALLVVERDSPRPSCAASSLRLSELVEGYVQCALRNHWSSSDKG